MKGLKTQKEPPYCPECTDWAITKETELSKIWWCRNCRKPVEEQMVDGKIRLYEEITLEDPPPLNETAPEEYLFTQKEETERDKLLKEFEAMILEDRIYGSE